MKRVRLTSRERLAQRLTDLGLICSPSDLWPTRGYWLHNTQDCYRWQGQALWMFPDGHVRRVSLFSWDTMKVCARSKDLRIEHENGNLYEWEVWSHDPR